MQSSFIYMIIALLVGVGIPIGATLNAGLATRIGSPSAAALCLFSVGAVVASVVFTVSRSGAVII